jgi:predicted bacteriocin transport accessory protein
MKKFLVIFLFALFFITGCGNKKYTTYDEISFNDYKSMIDNKESFPMVIGSSTCSACSLFKPTMETFIKKYNIDVKYVDISKLSEEDGNEFSSLVGFKSTPTTVFVKDGKLVSYYYWIIGSDSLNGVVDAYKRMGYIGE